jgi:hypothetical protein
MAMASASCKKPRGGELGLERKRDASTERERGTFSPTDGNLHCCRRSTPAQALSNGGMSWSPWRRVSVVREGVGEKQMSGGGVLQRGAGLYLARVVSVQDAPRR